MNSKQILVLHGPNLNLLGHREPQIYGTRSLEDINQKLIQIADEHQVNLECKQSQAEHQLIDWIHDAYQKNTTHIIINPAGLTHTSVCLRDALLAVGIPYIEVHLSNIFAREAFRTHSYISDQALGVISGFGSQSYELALQVILKST
jgi:3-dehydroquinate dehydratase-2